VELYDQHLHSRHSFDSESDPAENVEAAVARGLAGLTFTEHFDTHPDDWRTCRYNHEAYSETIQRLRARFGSTIFIGKGIEVCYQPDTMDFALDHLSAHSFDMVIMSVHYFRGRPVHIREEWAGLEPAEGTRRYLETVLEAVRFCERLHAGEGRVFDVLAHLDLVKRYTRRFFGVDKVSLFPDLIDEILRTCLAADVIPEINTSTLRQELSEPMPRPETMARYAALGGSAMTIGSDAHRSKDIGTGLNRAIAMLRTAGLRSVAVFKDRQRTEIRVA
jgi:histidinol-phosphatase (PHP family)